MKYLNSCVLCTSSLISHTMAAQNSSNLLYLFDRPTEPLFIGKGDDPAKLVSFDVPPEYLVSLILLFILEGY